MTIYGRTGEVVTVVRLATLVDVKALDGRSPDDTDREAIRLGSYVVVKLEDGRRKLYHQAFLRADEGSREITEAIGRAEERLARVRPEVVEFLDDIEQVCSEHGLCISHVYVHAPFRIVPFDPDIIEWLREADDMAGGR